MTTGSNPSDVGTPPGTDVTLIRWPHDAARRDNAALSGAPRLLLVEPDVEAPASVDVLEDWVRLPASDADVQARIATLRARAAQRRRPLLDGDGVLRVGSDWVALSPLEARLAGVLLGEIGTVVSRESLTESAWAADPPSRNALDVHVLRLRRRIEPLGLEIRTVRSRGYLLQSAARPGPTD